MKHAPKPREEKANPRGLFERPPGSGVWWINYYVDGKQHREKVGRKSDAIDLYHKRKADARAGRKLPTLRATKAVMLSDLIDDALEFVADHKDRRNYISRAAILKADLGSLPAEDLTPQDIDRWLRSRDMSPATANRYRSLLSLCYREAMANGKVSSNPARLVRQRKESSGRLRFLSREEYTRLCAIVKAKYPQHLPALIVSVNTGMRFGEQFSTTWVQFHEDRRCIELSKTKNGSARTVHLNSVALDAVKSIRPAKPKPFDLIFPHDQKVYDVRSWFPEALKEAHISDYTWHGNRHTFCSWLAMAGATIKEIQEAAGHKTITMSARYAHLTKQHTQSVVERIAQA